MDIESILRNHDFTRGLAGRHIVALAALATPVAFAENEVILMDRRQSDYFYLVTSGSVSIELHSPIFTVSVLTVSDGQAFGWSALLDRQDTVFQVRARQEATALRISGPELTQACRNDGELGVEILLRALQVAAGRIQATEARFAEMCGVRIQSSSKKEHSLI
jgi:CRP-like cAMP-binding protein